MLVLDDADADADDDFDAAGGAESLLQPVIDMITAALTATAPLATLM